MIGVLGFLDYKTGFEVSFALFYLIPVILTAWYGGRLQGLVAAVLSAITWQASNQLAGEAFSNPLIPYWNAVARLMFFAIFALLLTKLREVLEHEQSLSRTDYLTGAANSRMFYEQAEAELERSRRYKHPVSLAYIDFDNFKQMNDRFGHAGGDQALKTVVREILDMIRTNDTVARMGGDEFVLLLPETNADAAKRAVGRLHEILLQEMNKRQWPVTFSIGVVTFNTAPAKADDMVRAADALMYSVKDSGKNRMEHRVIQDPTV